MTYFGFLARFLIIPLLVLLGITAWDLRQGNFHPPWPVQRAVWLAIGLHILLALVYTTPWDNYLVATKVWSYKDSLVSGLLIGWVPLEEYLFFVLETLLTGLWWWLLERHSPAPAHFHTSKKLRLLALVLAGLFWLAALFILVFRWVPGSYLALILIWALPAIAPQLAFGADILWQRRRLLALTVLPLFFYFSLADAFAIASGTWRINPNQSTALLLGPLPVEEALFFGVTVTLISFGLTLALSHLSRARWQSWLVSNLPKKTNNQNTNRF